MANERNVNMERWWDKYNDNKTIMPAEKTFPVQLCPKRSTHELALDQIRVSSITGWWPTGAFKVGLQKEIKQ
jgi:hypothetical protein